MGCFFCQLEQAFHGAEPCCHYPPPRLRAKPKGKKHRRGSPKGPKPLKPVVKDNG
jgi:hypothetical protein